uniref:U1740q n=1 Tax=Mycobacterium leprae TaxID=1769 RepID=Q50076_MYCLR|nr:u1740q [Mycobacterium leprae]
MVFELYEHTSLNILYVDP